MNDLSAMFVAIVIASIIVPISFKEAIKREWVTEKEAKLTLAITAPVYIIAAIAVIYYL